MAVLPWRTATPRPGVWCVATLYMERVSRFLEEEGETSKRKVEEGVTGKGPVLRKALEILCDEGFVEAVERTFNGGLGAAYRSVKPLPQGR